MNLVIDIGNTRTKCSVFRGIEEIYYESSSPILDKDLKNIFTNYPKINQAIISSTGKNLAETANWLKNRVKKVLIFKQSTPLPFITAYETPNTIGLDRLAAIAGAQNMYPSKNVLIIDTGTAITYDVITSEGKHVGGNISPGLKMRFKALNEFTDKLPLVSPNNNSTLLGKNTKEAISNGVVNGIVYEIESTIYHSISFYKDLTILLTGGDAEFFEIYLKKSIFVVSNLVNRGLNIILNYNAANI